MPPDGSWAEEALSRSAGKYSQGSMREGACLTRCTAHTERLTRRPENPAIASARHLTQMISRNTRPPGRFHGHPGAITTFRTRH